MVPSSAENMPVSGGLTEEQVALLGRLFKAAVDGPYFPDWEFATLFGFTREELGIVSSAWPNRSSCAYAPAVLNQPLGYPHGLDGSLERAVRASRDELEQLCKILGKM